MLFESLVTPRWSTMHTKSHSLTFITFSRKPNESLFDPPSILIPYSRFYILDHVYSNTNCSLSTTYNHKLKIHQPLHARPHPRSLRPLYTQTTTTSKITHDPCSHYRSSIIVSIDGSCINPPSPSSTMLAQPSIVLAPRVATSVFVAAIKNRHLYISGHTFSPFHYLRAFNPSLYPLKPTCQPITVLNSWLGSSHSKWFLPTLPRSFHMSQMLSTCHHISLLSGNRTQCHLIWIILPSIRFFSSTGSNKL